MNKKVIISIIIGVVIASTLGAYFVFSRPDKSILTYVDPHLTQQELDSAHKIIEDLQQKINAEQSDTEKYKLLLALGAEQNRIGELVDAKESFFRASKILPENGVPVGLLFQVENSMHDFKSAKLTIEKATQLNPTSGLFWKWRVELMQSAFDASKDEADALYQEGLQKANNSIDLLASYAPFLEKNNDLAGAVAQWKKAIEVNPAATDLYQAEIKRIQDKLK
jgi:Tfp pilus assembly protein PilF